MPTTTKGAAAPAIKNGANAPDEFTTLTEVDATFTAEVADSAPDATNPFAALGLARELQSAVAALGFVEPTPVQLRAIPLALQPNAAGFNDLMVSSQTGSGKTAAYLLPVLHTLITMQAEKEAAEHAAWQAQVDEAVARGEAPPKRQRRRNPMNPRQFKAAEPGALVLAPTRELAQQVARDAIDLVQHVRGLRIADVVGGMPYGLQIQRLQNADLVVATPGRLLDLHEGGQIKLDKVRFLVVDEADRMLDLGFADALAAIHALTAQRQQTMMFSATFAPPIQQLAMRVMHEGGSRVQRVEIDTPAERHANIEQRLYWADHADHRRALLDHWLRDPSIGQAIVFANTQIECEQLAEDLQQSGFAAVSLHGALSQALRNRRLKSLRDGRVQILVATDVAARGIDVPSITHVINYGLPMKAEDYTHRIGRTGRAGRDGLAVTIAEIRDRRRLAAIEGHTQQHFRPHTIPGLEPTRHFPPVSEPMGARGRGRPGSGPGRRGAPAERRGPRMMGEGFGAKSGPGRRAAPTRSYQNDSFRGDAPHARPRAPARGEGFGASPWGEGAPARSRPRDEAPAARKPAGPRAAPHKAGARPGAKPAPRKAPAGKAYVPRAR